MPQHGVRAVFEADAGRGRGSATIVGPRAAARELRKQRVNGQIQGIARQVRAGSPRALARALSEVENRGPRADALLAELFPGAPRARRVGVTGAPGVGKSTLVNGMARHLREAGLTVAVLAVDPTSPFSGGAVLGDRVRMQAHHEDAGVFIRSMATRGALGGLAPAVGDAIAVLEAFGSEVIVIETVGAGQAEVDIAQLADAVCVVLTPDQGDDIQAAKAGVMEIADVFAVNKADRPGAERLEQQLRAMLSLLPAERPQPPIVRTSAAAGDGVADLTSALLQAPARPGAAKAYWRRRLLERISEGLLLALGDGPLAGEALDRAAEDVAAGRLNPYDFVGRVVAQAAPGGGK